MNIQAITIHSPVVILLFLLTIICVLLIIFLLKFIFSRIRTKSFVRLHSVPHVSMENDHHENVIPKAMIRLRSTETESTSKNFTSAEISEWHSRRAFQAYFRDTSTGWEPGPHEMDCRQAAQIKRMLLVQELVHSCGDGACKEHWCRRCELPKCEQEFRVKGLRALSTVCLSCRTLQSKLLAFHVCDEGTCEGEFCPSCNRLRCRDYFRKNPRKPQLRERMCIECYAPGYAELYETSCDQYENQRKEHSKMRQVRMKRAKEATLDIITEREWNALKAHYEYQCLSCGRKEPAITLTKDHIVPISNGGLHCIENIQPLYQRCNSQKNAQTIDYRSLFQLREWSEDTDHI